MARHFYIIGAGPGANEFLTGYAAEKLKNAELVLAAPRLARLRRDALECPYTKLAGTALQSEAKTVAILVSGDVGFFSISRKLREELLPYGEVELVCGISSMQYFCAKTGVPYDGLCFKSLHGRKGSILGVVSYNRLVFLLTGGCHTAVSIFGDQCKAGLGGLTVHIGENLGSASERVETGTAEGLLKKPCSGMAVLLIENPGAANSFEPVRDNMMTRSNVPMTKEEARWVSVGKLGVRPTDVVWDIGAGTGSVSLELARKASDGVVYAIEQSPEAAALLEVNRCRLGGYNVSIIRGNAPEILEGLPVPNRVFIGGSGGHLSNILKKIKALNPEVRAVVNAVTLETLHEAHSAMHGLGFKDIEVTQLAASRGKKAGRYTMLEANNPVFIISGGGLYGS